MKTVYFITVLFLSVISLNGADRKELLESLEKISEINRQLNTELTNWNSERETLKLQLSLLKGAMEDQEENHQKLAESLKELKEKKAGYQATLAKQQKLHKKIHDHLDKNCTLVISAAKMVPYSLQFLIKDELAGINGLLNDKDSSPEEKLNSVKALTFAILKIQKEVHTVKEVITLGDKKVEARTIFLGTYTGYFGNSSQKIYGRFIFKDGAWKAEEDKSLAGPIEQMFNQFDQQGKPKLVPLPVGESGK